MTQTYSQIQRDLLSANAHGLSWSEMQRESGISATTIKRFANDLTLRPQFRTVEVLAEYAGFAIDIQMKIYNHVNRPQLRRRRG